MRGSSLLLVLVAVAVSGCASSRIVIETLPEAPIAFLYWQDKASQKRSDAFAKVSELPPLPPDKEDPEGQQELEIRAHLRAEEAVRLDGDERFSERRSSCRAEQRLEGPLGFRIYG